MPLTFRDFSTAFRKLEIERNRPVIAHVALSAFGEVHGGEDTLLGALLMSFNTLVMPTFTYKTMVIPEVGPPENAITYGSGKDTNRMVEFFQPEMPADPLMGRTAETLRRHPKARRSSHPILSFAGVNADEALNAQTRDQPLTPIYTLRNGEGWVLLLGVDHTVNTSIHYAEWVAGRKQFVRWALTPQGIVACAGWPGCSDGFLAVAPRLDGVTRRVQVGQAEVQAIPLADLTEVVCAMIGEDPQALLCARPDCERCNAVRASL